MGECIFIYLVSITHAPAITATLYIRNDSVTFYNGRTYQTEPILNRNGSILLTRQNYIFLQAKTVTIGVLGESQGLERKYRKTKIKSCYTKTD